MPKLAFRSLLPVFLLAFMLALMAGCSAEHSTHSAGTNATSAPATKQAAKSESSKTGFASREKLLEHFQKHGNEFGNITVEQYLELAQSLRDRPAGGPILESKRDDGVITRFDRNSGTFIAFNSDGVIRTCFKPNDGEAYFRRQLRRGA
jgi:pyocin large subunit-like protein